MFCMIERKVKNKSLKKNHLQLIELEKAECELEIIQREMDNSYSQDQLENIFNSYSRSSMMSAKFYSECRMLGIPCLLEVNTQFGRLDAIIEIKNKYFIIEFKSRKNQTCAQETHSQLQRYLLHNNPVILVWDHLKFPSILCKLKRKNLQNKIYMFENDRFKLIH